MNAEKLTLNIHQILKLLPHRYPILLVDRVLDLEPHKSITALKNVTINEPYFVGHFPARPVMPGVLILEALAQTAALLTFAEEPHDASNTLYYFVGIDGARFKRVVEPGDQLILNVKFERHMRGIWKFAAHAEVDGALAAEATLMCTVKRIDDEEGAKT
jgi:3-hydroxyacyl-[acyl-carrier-protein] dehydratase